MQWRETARKRCFKQATPPRRKMNSENAMKTGAEVTTDERNYDNNITREIFAFADQPLVYRIDLSLPPAQRYVQVAADFKDDLIKLSVLFREVIMISRLPFTPVNLLSKVLLRKLYSEEQTQELSGISKVTGLGMHHLVALNVLLDLFMGCTSGGIRCQEEQQGPKMIHFRTLDWGMESLRKVIAVFEFVNEPNGKVIARSISYVGFVGVLTGVRQGLSISLNFRPYRNDQSRTSNLRFHAHLLAVLLGLRPSISAVLRDLLLGKSDKLMSLDEIASTLPTVPTTAAYLTFCDGKTTLVMEKDVRSADVQTSSSFITVTNHDVHTAASGKCPKDQKLIALGMQDLLDDSALRKQCLQHMWDKVTKEKEESGQEASISLKQVRDWINVYPVTNEETHFSALLDPTAGTIVRVERFGVQS